MPGTNGTGGGGKGRALTGLLLVSVGPLGDGEMDQLAAGGLGLEGLLEAAAHQLGADVGVADVGHPRRAPEGHRRRLRRHCRVPPLVSSSRAAAAACEEEGCVRGCYQVVGRVM